MKITLIFLVLICSVVSSASTMTYQEATDNLKLSVSPNQPVVLNAMRSFDLGGGSLLEFPAPNTQFKLEIDNTKGKFPIYISQVDLIAIYANGQEYVKSIDPTYSLAYVNPGNGATDFINRVGFVSILPFQKANILENTWFIIGSLPLKSQPEPYHFELVLKGWFGTQSSPIANFRKSIKFEPSKL